MPDIEMFSVIPFLFFFHLKFNMIHECPNGGCAMDINYLSITVCDTINLLSAGFTND